MSSRTYLTFGYWKDTQSKLKPGDYLLIQFGHNDASPINDDQRARGTIRGSGDETEEIDNQLTGEHEVVHTYGWYLRNYIRDARRMGVHPIVCSPVPRKSWTGDRVNRSTSTYAKWSKEVAQAEGVSFIDLNDIIAQHYETIGQNAVEAYFADKHTHTTLVGARFNAESVIAGLNALKINELSDWLKKTGLKKTGLKKPGQRISTATKMQVFVPDARPVLGDPAMDKKASMNSSISTLYIMGDSTVRNGHLDGVGWGEVVGRYFDPSKLNVVNRAIGGRSTRSYMREKRWQEVLDQLKPGDKVLMQFGHNDGGRVGDPRFKRRAALPGIDDTTQWVTFEDGVSETVHTYGWYLRQFCEGAIQKGAKPIICSPVPHKNNWHDGQFKPDFADHRRWCKQVAEATGANYVNLTELVGKRYQELGEQKVETLFADARTHTNRDGALVNAACVVAGLGAIPEIEIKPFLSDHGQGVKMIPAQNPTEPSGSE